MSNDTIRWPGQLWASSASDLCCTWLSAFVGPETSLLSGLLPFEGCVLVTQSCPTLCNPMDYSPAGSSVHGINSPGKNTGEGCHALLQGIFPIQGLNLGLPHCRQILHRPRHQGSPNRQNNCNSDMLQLLQLQTYFDIINSLPPLLL